MGLEIILAFVSLIGAASASWAITLLVARAFFGAEKRLESPNHERSPNHPGRA